MLKQSKKLIVIIGMSGTGKTSLANYLCKKENAGYIDFDLIYDYKVDDNKTERLLKALKGIVTESKANTFVLDGFDQNCSLGYISKQLNLDPEVYFCFAAPHIIERRQNEKRKKNEYETVFDEREIRRLTAYTFFISSCLDDNLITVDTTNNELEFIKKDDWEKRWLDLIFLSELEKENYDKYYQRIELPSGVIIKGYSESEKTWERIKNLIDFKNKSVLDIGCFHGYFSFKIEESGAKDIIGLEKNEEAVYTARKIRLRKKCNVLFKIGEIENTRLKKHFDIILVLNMLHHVKNISKALDNIFSMGDCIIFEIPFEQEKTIIEKAKERNFQLSTKLDSHRDGREIIVLALPKSRNTINKNIEEKHKLTYSKYKKSLIKKRLKSFIKKFLPKFVITFYRNIKSHKK